jgi:alkaline phosphatase
VAAKATEDPPTVVVAVGDIACRPGARPRKKACQQARTARLAETLKPDAVLALGDLQYESGTLRAFRRSYDKSWGALKDITYPVPGNHEYRSGGTGYYRYFEGRQPGSPGYYAVDLGSWRAYALNSNCGDISCKKEYRWLRKDLAAHPRQCSIFAMHHPRFSSGSEHGSDPTMSRFFSIAVDHRVDLVLAGHDHDYERFAPMDADGRVDPRGMRQFVVGTGGAILTPFRPWATPGESRQATHHGVLQLTLREDGYDWTFLPVEPGWSEFAVEPPRDSGSASCH